MAQNPNGSNPLAIADVDNEVLREADEYLRKHKILELFEVRIHVTIFVAAVAFGAAICTTRKYKYVNA